MKVYGCILLAALSLASSTTTVLANCNNCAIACALGNVDPKDTPQTLATTCNGLISETLKTIGSPSLQWHSSDPHGKLNEDKYPFVLAGTADLIGNTPPHPTTMKKYGANKVDIGCPESC